MKIGNNSDVSCIILGGGIAGLSAAIALKQIGISAWVVEAAPEFKPVGAGIVLAANAMRAYDRLGLTNSLYHAGHEVRSMTILDDKGRVINKAETGELNNAFLNVAIHRGDLHRILASQLDPKHLLLGKRARGVTRGTDRVTVTFEDGESITADYLVAAEGIHSVVRKNVLPDSRLRYSGYTCWRGITVAPVEGINEAYETWGGNGRFGYVPVGDNRVYWYACVNAAADDPVLKRYTVNDLLSLFGNYHQPIPAILRNTDPGSLIWNDLYDLKPIHQYAFGNIVLVGDAAHATTPNMGQGACMAIEDAVILASCIRRSSAIPDAFREFERLRIPRTHYIVDQSWKIGKVAQWQNRVLRGVRDRLMRAIPQKYYQKQVQEIYNITFD
jgi:2-polyprenyl-6-methoxyphenol hydroxylase-like FAD-dependent oxidoreductase